MIKFYGLFLALIIFSSKVFSNSDSLKTSNNSFFSDSIKAGEYFTKGINYSDEQEFDRSIIFFKKAKQIFENYGLWNKSIEALIEIGNSLKSKGELDSALQIANEALLISKNETNIDDSLTGQIYNLFGYIFNSKGEYDKALDNARRAKSLLNDSTIQAAQNFSLKGMIYSNIYKPDSALTNLKKAIEIERRILGKDHPSIGTEYNTMASLYEQKGNYEKGLDYYFKSLKLKLKSLGEKHISILYNNIAANYFYQGEYDLALEYYFKSLNIDKNLLEEDHPNFGYRYNNIAMVYRVKSDYEKALEYGIKSKNIFSKTYGNTHPNYAGVLNNIGKTYFNIGSFDRAVECYKKSLDIFKDILGNSHPIIAKLLQNIGDVYMEKSEYKKSLSYFDNALKIRKNAFGEKHPKIAESFKKIGDVYFVQNEFQSALVNYQNAIISFAKNFNDKNSRTNPALKNLPPRQYMLAVLHQKSKVFSEKYDLSGEISDLKSSLNTYLLCSELISKIRDSYSTESSKLFLDKRNYEIFPEGINAALKLFEITGRDQYKEIAFNFSEANKAAVLVSSLNDLRAKRYSGIPDSLLAIEKELKLELSYYNIQIEKEKFKKKIDSARLTELQDSFFALHRKYEKLLENFENNYPKYFHLKHNPQSYSFEEIQGKVLDKENAIVEYVVGDSTLFIFLILKNNIAVESIALNQSIGDLVRNFRKSLTNLSFKDYLNSAHELYNILIKPVSKKLSGINKIYVIPDGILNYLPFGALLKNLPGQQEPDFANLDYLIEDFSIEYSFSASLLCNSLKESFGLSKKFIGIAPVFSDEKTKSQIASLKNVKSDLGSKRKIKFGGKTYSSLPESKIELKKIKNLFDENGLTAKIFIHSKAKEEIMKSDKIYGYDFIHIASHGFFNDRSPELSGILFSSDSSNEDGVLYSREIYNLNLNTDLAVLSSCESGLGKIVRGEGIIGLTRGFIYSGVSNLIVSLWQVSDISTAELMVEFYKNVLSGKDYAHSLRLAKLKLIIEGKFSYPLEWCSFILLGR